MSKNSENKDLKSAMFTRASNRIFKGLELNDKQTFKPFCFVQMADTQFGFMSDDQEWEEEIRLAKEAVTHVNRIQPAFAIVCGDLTNSLIELSPDIDPTIRDRQVADFKKVFENVDDSIPLVCVCGNHDVGNAPTPKSMQRWKNDFGDDFFSFWTNNVCCLVVNSNLLNDPTNMMDYFNEQMNWIEQQLKSASENHATHTMLFMHHPLFLVRGDEPDDDDDLFGFTEFTFAGNGLPGKLPNSYFHIRKEFRMKILTLMKNFGAKLIFSGHWHRNGVIHAGGEFNDIIQIITSAVGRQLGDDKSGLRIVQVEKDKIDYPYYSFEELNKQN